MKSIKEIKKMPKLVRIDRLLYVFLKTKNIITLYDLMLFVKDKRNDKMTLNFSDIIKSNIFLLRKEFENLIANYSEFVKIDITDEEINSYLNYTEGYHNQRVADYQKLNKYTENIHVEPNDLLPVTPESKKAVAPNQNSVENRFLKDKILYLPVFATDDIRL